MRALAVSVTILVLAGPARADELASRLAGGLLIDGQAYEYVRALCDDVGPRMSGTPGEERAAAWAVERLRAVGLTDVKTERFPLPAGGWQRGTARLRLLAPTERTLHVSSVPWSASTPAAGLRGELVLLDTIIPAEIDARAGALRGKIVLVDLTKQRGLPRETLIELMETGVPRLQATGALAVLWSSFTQRQGVRAVSSKLPRGIKLPSADVGAEDHQALVRLLERGPARVELQLSNRSWPEASSQNVSAVLRGRELPDEEVIVSAHLDSWDLSPGAQDNATGVAMVLDAARAMVALGRPPRRTIRFVLWGAEEQGLVGSRVWARAHEAELDRVVAVVNTDHGASDPDGWNTGGRDDVAAALRPVLGPMLEGLGTAALLPAANCSSDHAPFMVRGIPTLELANEEAKYADVHHQVGDTLDKVSRHYLAVSAATVAVTAYVLADLPARVGPRVDAAAVDKAGLAKCRARYQQP